ncbi:hypothetical protein ACOME3_004686 [Neoechinorhynchus agilis]
MGAQVSNERAPNDEEICFVADALGLSEENVKRMHEDFVNYSSLGRMTKGGLTSFYKHIDNYGLIVSNSKRHREYIADKMFKYFEINNDGFLSFTEFLLGLVMLHSKVNLSPKSKLEYLMRSSNPDNVISDHVDALKIYIFLGFLDDFYSIECRDKVFGQLCQKGYPMHNVPIEDVFDLIEKSGIGKKMIGSVDLSNSETSDSE